MKFTPEHYAELKGLVAEVVKKTGKSIKQCRKDYEAINLSEIRFLWDLFWLTKWPRIMRERGEEMDYLDTHISTALRKIVKELEEGK